MALNCSTAQDVSKVIEENGIEFVDLRFTDLFGQWHHFSVPVDFYDEDDLFKSGLGFDGSSIRGFKSIESSDMLLVCDPTTAFVDPMTTNPTLCVIANVYEPGTYDAFDRDPRNVARKAEVKRVLSNSFGFGGQNTCLVIAAGLRRLERLFPKF